MTTPTQIDTSPVTRELTRLISKGTTSEQVLLTTAVRLFPGIDFAGAVPGPPMCSGRC